MADDNEGEGMAQKMSMVAAQINEAIKPLLDIDEDGCTDDYHVAIALSALGSVAGSLLCQRTESEDRLLSTFWDSVTSSTRVFKTMVDEARAQRQAEKSAG